MHKQTMHKFGYISLILTFIVTLAWTVSPGCFAHDKKKETTSKVESSAKAKPESKEEKKEGDIVEKASEPEKKKPIKPTYYTLVDKNIQPEEDEFYLSSIYKVRGAPKALIARSKNTRAGKIFTFAVEYSIGDELTNDLIIKNIVLGTRKHIIVFRKSSEEYFMLKMSYGKATSRLVKLIEEDAKKFAHK